MKTDFSVQNEGSIFLLVPQTSAAVDWCDEHLPDEAMRWGSAYVVEHRYIETIVTGIVADGLEVS